MGLFSSFFVLASLVPGQQPATDFEQDFRGGEPVHPSLSLFGAAADEVVKVEPAGLRITLPTNGRQTYGWGVVGNFGLSGDFEVTAGYELLTVDRPVRGSGAGVALNLQPDEQRSKWAKIGRFVRPDGKACYAAECWTKKKSPKHYHQRFVPTDARGGKLRLERKESLLRFLAADAPGDAFQEILRVDFGPEDMSMVRFIANNNSSPTAVDARLLNLKVRSGNLIEAPALDMSKAWLPAVLLVFLLLGLAGFGLFMWWHRQRRPGATASAPASSADPAFISFACSACGKSLRSGPERAGNKVKCPGCGQTVVVPVALE